MNTFTIADAFSHGWNKTKESFKTTALVLVSYAIISAALSRVSENAKDHVVFNIVSFVFTLAISIAIRIGLTRYFLNAEEGKASYKDLFNTDGVYFTYFVAYVVLTLITVAGLFLLIVPGIIIVLMYFFVPTLVIDRKMEVMEAFKESSAMMKGHKLHLLAFLLVSLVVNFVGLLIVVVGLLVTVPMTFFASLYIYRRLLNAEIPMTTAEIVPPEEAI